MTLTVTIISSHDQVDDISTTSTAYRIIYFILIELLLLKYVYLYIVRITITITNNLFRHMVQ